MQSRGLRALTAFSLLPVTTLPFIQPIHFAFHSLSERQPVAEIECLEIDLLCPDESPLQHGSNPCG